MGPRPSSSIEYYDSVADCYDHEIEARRTYLEAVDAIVIEWCRRRTIQSILDFGCGNGRRLRRISETTQARGVGIDVSPRMVAAACANGVDAHLDDITACVGEGRPEKRRFDLVMSLWNVLGHVGGPNDRLAAIRQMRAQVNNDGIVIVDVNNRHNAAAYGWPKVLRNLASDRFRGNQAGDFLVTRQTSDRLVSTIVHLFALEEIIELFRSAGLRPKQTYFLDYESGQPARNRWRGQLCVVAEPV